MLKTDAADFYHRLTTAARDDRSAGGTGTINALLHIEASGINPKRARGLLDRWEERRLLVVCGPLTVRIWPSSPRRLEATAGQAHHIESIALIRNGPRPDYYHPSVPHHPVLIVARKRVFEALKGWTGDGRSVWSHEGMTESSGWFLERWNGLDIDYGPVVRSLILPDGTTGAFIHDRNAAPWTLISGAVWMDDRYLPDWLEDRGVIYPPDAWTRRQVMNSLAHGMGNCNRDDTHPPFWPALAEERPA